MAVLFTASWCPFCRMFNPIFESALGERNLPRAVTDLTDLDNPLWEALDISVVPTVVVFRKGQPVFRKDGVLGRGLSKEVMSEIVQQLGGN